MGQNNSTVQDVFPIVNHIMHDEPNTLISQEIKKLTYKEFLQIIIELNAVSRNSLDQAGKQMKFAIKKGTENSMFWKSLIEIACLKIDPITQEIENYRILSLEELLKVYKTIKCQSLAMDQSKSEFEDVDKDLSEMFYNINAQLECSSDQCCICFDRKQDMTLPCAHSYCNTCFEEWNSIHATCPICRDKVDSTDDAWVLSEKPHAEEITKEIQLNLMELTEDKSFCAPS